MIRRPFIWLGFESLFFCSAALAAGLPTARPEAVGMSSERLERIGEISRRYVDEGKLACVMTMVARHGKLVHYEVVAGTPYLEVIKRVNNLGHDLVLTVPMPPIRRVGLGSSSTTMHLLRKCPCPVWIDRPAETLHYETILAAVDPKEGPDPVSRMVMDLATSMAQRETARVAVVHAWYMEGESILRDEQGRVPDVLLVDGGKEQLKVAVEVLEDLGIRYHLGGLGREELPAYLAHRLRLAACELPLFEPPAVEAIFQATQALPRKVNRLAHYALTAAAIAKAKAVTVEHVQAALTEAG